MKFRSPNSNQSKMPTSAFFTFLLPHKKEHKCVNSQAPKCQEKENSTPKKKKSFVPEGQSGKNKSKHTPTDSSPPSFPSSSHISSPAFALRTPLRRKTQTRSTRKDSARRRAGRIDPPNPPRRRKRGRLRAVRRVLRGMVTAWERARRALATRLCMRFPARHADVKDVPRGLDAVEEPLAAVEEEEDQQQQQQPPPPPPQGEREKSLGAVSPAPASPRRPSRSGSRSPAVRSLSFSPCCRLAFLSAAHGPWCMGCANSFMILRRVSPCSWRRYGLLGTGIAVVWKLDRNSLKRDYVSKLER